MNKSTHKELNPGQQETSALVQLFSAGRLAETAVLAQAMTERFPLYGFGWKILGVALKQSGRSSEALLPMQKAAELLPNDAEAHSNLGATLQDLGRLAEAEVSLWRALELDPNNAYAYWNLGNILQELGRLEEVEACYRRALQIDPNAAHVHCNLGIILHNLGRLEEAEACYRRALQIRPDYAEAYSNLGISLQELGRLEEAEANCRRALEVNPGYVNGYNNLGITLHESGRLSEAEAVYLKALQIAPENADALSNLGSAYFAEGRFAEAEASWRHALSIRPGDGVVYSNLLFCLSQNAAIDPKTLFAEHRRFGERAEAPFRGIRKVHANVRDPARTLRIGFVSADLSNHAVASFVEPLLMHLSGCAKLSLYAYANQRTADATSLRLRGYFAHWQQIVGMSDATLAQKIEADGIDILIDLSGHSVKNRLPAFARKPAPLQVTWIGYPGTTGLSAMDYYFSDRIFLPPGQFDDQFTEKIVRLPASAPFLPSASAPPVNALPALDNGYLTFGSFNRIGKLTQSVIALWSQLLRALPESRMVLGGMPEAGSYQALIEWFAQEGISGERLTFHRRSGMEQYLSLHHQVDVCLDTFPYNGGTTTLHALWMGVPTLTLAGATTAGRTGAAILGHAGLDAFVAHDAADFVQKGLYWAKNPGALAQVRAGVREHFARSPMGQPQVVGAGLELALRIMWQRWCAGLPAQSFDVSQPELAQSAMPDAAVTLEQTLAAAVARHQAGELQEAEKSYQAILQIEPKHPKANHNLGVLYRQLQQPDVALSYFMTALESDPTHGQYWLSYIDALCQVGQLDVARQVLALARQQGLAGDEVEALARRLQASPSSAEPAPAATDAQSGQGQEPSAEEIRTLEMLFNQGQYKEAVTLAGTLVQRFPRHSVAWKMLGVLCQRTGRNTEALGFMQKAAALSPGDAEVHNNLGIIFRQLGRLGEAEMSHRRALEINPRYAEAHNFLGATLMELGRLNEAEASQRQALQLNPNLAEAHNFLGVTLRELGRLQEAEASQRRALQISPDSADVLGNLGNTLRDMGRLAEAEDCYRRALQIKPDFVEVLSNLGVTLNDLGRQDEAEASYRRAVELNPDFAVAHSNLLFYLSHSASVDAQTLFTEHCRFGEQFEAGFLANWPQHGNARDTERRLQIGFVSGDFRTHALASFIEPVLAHLSGYAQLSVHAYANHTIDDDTTRRLQGHFAHWNQISGLSDAALAEKIRADGIDVLIDLSGHTARNRLLVFARKPAPVQASWMGYPCTTGLSAIDYYLSDRYLLPQGQFDSQFTEKIVRLPANAPMSPSRDAPPPNGLPALDNGFVTFGSFNRVSKLSRSVVALWSRILRDVPDSRMLLGGMPREGRYDSLVEWFAQEGIAERRLDFHARDSMANYLKLHHQVDICLDTAPYAGGTTTLHALWMGVPTITLAGSTAAGRTGAGILGHAGLDGFVAYDADDFVRKGLLGAHDLPQLAALRQELRGRVAQSAMGHAEYVAAGLERALRIMWRRWCAGLPAESFEVTQQEIIETTGAGKND